MPSDSVSQPIPCDAQHPLPVDPVLAEQPQAHWAVDLVVAETEPVLFPRRQAEPTRQRSALSELQALRQAAAVGAQQKQRYGSLLSAVKASIASSETVGHYAAPLSPLRDRDLEALLQLFNCPDMPQIEADVKQMLLRLFPEPCWEDEIMDLLQL